MCCFMRYYKFYYYFLLQMQLTFSSEETTNIYIYTRKYAAVATTHNSSRIVGKKRIHHFMTAIFICLIVCVCLWRFVLHVLFLTPKFMRALHASWLFSRYVYISHPSCCFLLLLLLHLLLCCYMSYHSLHTRFFFCFCLVF